MSSLSTQPKLDLLLVENNANDTQALSRAFSYSKVPHALSAVSTATAGLKYLEAARAASRRVLVLLDLDLPGMNGAQFLARLRGDDSLSMTPVIILTSHGEPEMRRAVANMCVAGFFVKPLRFEALMDFAHSFLAYWSRVQLG